MIVDSTRQLRWYVGLFIVFFAIMPILGMTLVATDPAAADNEVVPVLIAAPINVIGLVSAVAGMSSKDPRAATVRLAIGAGLVLVGDILLFSLRALVA